MTKRRFSEVACHNTFCGDMQKFVMFGDSITQFGAAPGGIHNLMANHYIRRILLHFSNETKYKQFCVVLSFL